MIHLAYVDCSNLFIEGQKVSAVAKGMAGSLEDARARGVIDFGYRLDLHRLMALLRRVGVGEGDLRAVVFGSVTDSNEGLWRHADNAGFEVVTVERGFAGKEKRVDTSLVTHMCRDAYRYADPRRDRITLVAGDGDYEPAVRQLVADGFAVTGCTGHMPAGNCARPQRPSTLWTPTSETWRSSEGEESCHGGGPSSGAIASSSTHAPVGRQILRKPSWQVRDQPPR